MDKVVERNPDQESRTGFRDRCILVATYARRTLSFLLASGLILAGLALSVFEIVSTEGLKLFVLFWALMLVTAGGAWLLDEFVPPLWIAGVIPKLKGKPR